MKIGILALQGAFIEHSKIMEALGAIPVEIRKKSDFTEDLDGIILPGGESTVMGKLLKELDLFHLLKDKIQSGFPVLATCSGLILLSEELWEDNTVHLGTLPVVTKRNAYGRQLGSFAATAPIKDIGNFPMVFIRAPLIQKVSQDVDIIARVNDEIVGVKYDNQIALTFHPELTSNHKIHSYFLDICKN